MSSRTRPARSTVRLMTGIAAALLALGTSCWVSTALADTSFGDGLRADDTTLISTLLSAPDAYVDKVVRVSGVVTDVCAKRGCWVTIASDQEFQTLRFKVQDGIIVFTPDVKGKQGTFEGVFHRYETTQEEAIARAQHHAEEQGLTFDPASVTGPEVWYQLDGTGAVVQ